MNQSDILYVDTSTLRSVACSTEAVMRWVHGYTSVDERAYLHAGTAGHEAYACWFRQDTELRVDADGKFSHNVADPVVAQGTPRDTALAAFQMSYEAWADANVLDPNDRLSYRNTSSIVAAWLDTHSVARLPFVVNPELIEIGFAFPLTDDIVFCGRMDGIVKSTEQDAFFVLENKFPGAINENWLRSWALDAQLSGYLWAAQQHVSKPVLGVYLNATEFSRLPSDPSRRCAKHSVPYSECSPLHMKSNLLIEMRTPEQLEEWKRTAIHLANRFRDLRRRFPEIQQIHSVRMQGTYFNRCQFCAFYNWCKAGRQFEHLKTMLVVDPWEPFTGAFSAQNSGRKP